MHIRNLREVIQMANKKVSKESLERQSMLGAAMNFATAEAYKVLRTNILFSFSESDGCKVIGVTSSFKGEGKSITSLNLCYTIAETGKKVLIIEGDMRMPTFAKRLKLKADPGLSDTLIGLKPVKECIQKRVSEGDNPVYIDILVSGTIPPNPSELMGSEKMKALLEDLKSTYDYIILDLPPVTAVTDALIASNIVDGMIVVVRHNIAVRRVLNETMRQLKLVNCKILGFVYNGAEGSGSGYYHKKNYYYYTQ